MRLCLAESCTHSDLISHSGLFWVCIHLASIPRLCGIMPWHHSCFPHLWWRWRELPPTQEIIFKIHVFMSWDGYRSGYTKFHWRGLSPSHFFWPQEKGQERQLLEHAKDSNISVKDTLQFLQSSLFISRQSKFCVPIWLVFPCVPSPFSNTKKQDGVLTSRVISKLHCIFFSEALSRSREQPSVRVSLN